jgi:alkylation response protein AidB-like acyl-CoA dehydrogenase
MHVPDEVEQLLVASAGEFLEARHQTGRIKLNAVSPIPFDVALWREMGELGWLALLLPSALGGSGLGLTHAAALAERLGAGLVPEPYIACAIMPAALCALLLDTPERASIVDSLLTGGTPVTLAWQERAGQMEPLPTVMRLDAANRLSGVKVFVPNADLAGTLIILASRSDEPVLVTVRTGRAGIHQKNVPCGDRSHRSSMSFDRVPIDALLASGETAARAISRSIHAATLASAAYQSGLAAAVLQQILSYLRTRKQFDRPLGAFQTLQHLAADLYMLGQLARASWRHAAVLWDSEPASAAARAAISAAKARGAQAALRTSQAAIQIHGGLGFAEETGLGLALRIALQYSAWLGSSRHHLRRFAQFQGPHP